MIERKFEEAEVSNDLKILFIQQHSMKIKQGAFYAMESKRQSYLYAMEAWPYLAGAAGFTLFVGCAIVMPLNRKLLLESAACLSLGATISYGYPSYYWKQYIQDVNQVYFALRRV